jgi:hypothetical protein
VATTTYLTVLDTVRVCLNFILFGFFYNTFFCREKALQKATTNANFRRYWRTDFPAWLVCAQVQIVCTHFTRGYVTTERSRSIKEKKKEVFKSILNRLLGK